jgi:hypothetical protein
MKGSDKSDPAKVAHIAEFLRGSIAGSQVEVWDPGDFQPVEFMVTVDDGCWWLHVTHRCLEVNDAPLIEQWLDQAVDRIGARGAHYKLESDGTLSRMPGAGAASS